MTRLSHSLIVLIAVIASGCAVADRMSGVSESRRLQKMGVEASARVLDITDTGITVNEDPVVKLVVEVHQDGQPTYRATIPKSLISRVHVPQFQPGNEVRVRVDPSDPSRVALDMYKY